MHSLVFVCLCVCDCVCARAAQEERRKTYDRTPELIAFLDKVRLTPEKCQELYMCFRIMDLDGSGSIESDELYAWLQEMSSPFVLNMGAVIGLDKGSPLFFFDFLRMACIFCMFDDKELVKFAYDTFDEYGVRQHWNSKKWQVFASRIYVLLSNSF